MPDINDPRGLLDAAQSQLLGGQNDPQRVAVATAFSTLAVGLLLQRVIRLLDDAARSAAAQRSDRAASAPDRPALALAILSRLLKEGNAWPAGDHLLVGDGYGGVMLTPEEAEMVTALQGEVRE
jgi:hypothetical protein